MLWLRMSIDETCHGLLDNVVLLSSRTLYRLSLALFFLGESIVKLVSVVVNFKGTSVGVMAK